MNQARFFCTFTMLMLVACLGASDASRLCGQDQPESKPLDQKTFEKLHRELNPKNETWKTIPWQTSLLSAQQLAADQQKLIFIWAMDGHPLGCT